MVLPTLFAITGAIGAAVLIYEICAVVRRRRAEERWRRDHRAQRRN